MNKLTTYTATILAACACMFAAPNADAALTDTIKKIKKNVDKPADNSGKKAGETGTKANAEAGAQTTSTAGAGENKEQQITLCASLEKLGSSVEVRGERKNILFLKTTFKQQESHRPANQPAPPPEYSRDADAKSLYVIRLDTSDSLGSYPTARNLWRESRLHANSREVWPELRADYGWTEHPDGIGYVWNNWNSSSGSSLIVIATQKECGAFFETINAPYKEQLKPLAKDWQRVELGEMTQEEYTQKCQKIIDDAKANMWPKALKWAEGL